MNNSKHLKPNLVDPLISKKIIKTLDTSKENYWEPAKNSFWSFYQNYIRPNIFLIIVIIVILILLLFRYRIIKNNRETKTTNTPIIQHQPTSKKSTDTQEYADLMMHLYNHHKEILREPNNTQDLTQKNPIQFAYPMYPYAKGGSLAPGGTR